MRVAAKNEAIEFKLATSLQTLGDFFTSTVKTINMSWFDKNQLCNVTFSDGMSITFWQSYLDVKTGLAKMT